MGKGARKHNGKEKGTFAGKLLFELYKEFLKSFR